jgi:hypothetical protein
MQGEGLLHARGVDGLGDAARGADGRARVGEEPLRVGVLRLGRGAELLRAGEAAADGLGGAGGGVARRLQLALLGLGLLEVGGAAGALLQLLGALADGVGGARGLGEGVLRCLVLPGDVACLLVGRVEEGGRLLGLG